MKIVIAALNSKYIHMSLAPWCLRAACDSEIKILETNVNRPAYDLIRDIYDEKPDLLGFSCYIFNIIQIEIIVNDIKKLLPDVKIILGGPEVSFDAEERMKHQKNVDFIICGEGEKPFAELIGALCGERPLSEIPSLAYRGEGGGIIVNPPSKERYVNKESIYTTEMLELARGKIVYFESSRGCPYHCSFCLSSKSAGAAFLPLGQVKQELKKVMLSGARQIKFVDRTFNCNPARAKEIIRFIMHEAANDPTGLTGEKNYHFEAAADLFDDELIGLLASAPAGLFQLEIGIQSLNETVLAATDRVTDIEKCRNNIKRLLERGNMHIHVDLIAGLPLENYDSVARSFDGVYALAPHTIQLGFLKLLKGSKLREEAARYGIVYGNLPPYEVLKTNELSFDELARLKDIAEVVERLYNSGRFPNSLRFITGKYPTPFAFFEDFTGHLAKKGCLSRPLALRELYDRFAEFAEKKLAPDGARIFMELLKFDYFATDNACNPPAGLRRIYAPEIRELYLSAQKSGRPQTGRLHFERFLFSPLQYIKEGGTTPESVTLLFDYGSKDPVSGLYQITAV